jgi:hypothetical protein
LARKIAYYFLPFPDSAFLKPEASRLDTGETGARKKLRYNGGQGKLGPSSWRKPGIGSDMITHL